MRLGFGTCGENRVVKVLDNDGGEAIRSLERIDAKSNFSVVLTMISLSSLL